MWREDHVHIMTGNLRERLLDLGRVAVVRHAIGLHGLVCVAEMRTRVGRTACAGDAGNGVGDHEVTRGKPGLERGNRGKRRCRGIAARHCDENRLALLVTLLQREKPAAVELGQAVDRLAKKLGACVRGAVPLLVDGRIMQAVVRREVDDSDAQ